MTLAFTGNALAATEKAVFGGGCFWCMEPPYDKLEGVISTTSGYTGGHLESPSYQDVSSGRSGHVEVVEVSYDPEKVSYQQLLDVFWVNIDPLNSRGQFCDNGSQYLSAIFYLNEHQRRAAENSLKVLVESNILKGKIATTIRPAEKFYPAEEYHQNYYKKNPIRYHYYRHGCGRDKRLEALWKEVKLPF
ncbi:MAG: peptide-methionine (S)-S-oxide reductase MsrA [Porticoccus sp.]|nr:peptide-methionine (S)-S-oxide reductase MsrA [Porticoccus sp.]MBQ0806433.1 peptide-methionine (S)-S-oxide reductase MsrA [Porticoccus sp.]